MKTTCWELNDGRILRLEDSLRNDLVNDNPLLKAGCQAVLIRDERFTWLEMGGEYLADYTDMPGLLEDMVKPFNKGEDETSTAEEAEEFFTTTYGGGVFVMCYYDALNGEHVCRPVDFDPDDTGWWDATAWLVVPAGVDVDKVVDDYVLWMNGHEVQIFDNETGELIEAVLSSDDHEKIVYDRYDMRAKEREDI